MAHDLVWESFSQNRQGALVRLASRATHKLAVSTAGQLFCGSCQESPKDGNIVSAGSLHSIFSFVSWVKILDSLPVRDLRTKRLLSSSILCPSPLWARPSLGLALWPGDPHGVPPCWLPGLPPWSLVLPSHQACRGCSTPRPRHCWLILPGPFCAHCCPLSCSDKECR